MSTIQEKTNEIARILGVAPSEVSAHDPRWSQLLQEGVTVNVHVGRWRALTSLTLSDLGIYQEDKEDEAAFEALVELGKIRMLPKEIMDTTGSTESKIRQLPVKLGFKTHWGDFLTFEDFEKFKEEENRLREEYFQARDHIYAHWDTIQETMTDAWAHNARQAYRRAVKLTPEKMTLQEYFEEDNFVDAFVARMKRETPTRQEVYDSFTWEVEYNYVPLPDILAKNTASAEAIRLAAELDREQIETQITAERAKQEAELAHLQAEQEIARAEARAAWDVARQREEMLREMNREVVKKARDNADGLLTGFFADLFAKSRSMVATVYGDVQASIQRNGEIHPRSITQLSNLIEALESMRRFCGDTDLETLIAPARAIIETLPSARTDRLPDFTVQLDEIRREARRSLVALGRAERAGRELEEAASVAHKPRRTGRGTDEPAPAPVQRQGRRGKNLS